MIKKVLILLLIFMMCGCSNGTSLYSELESLGYKDEEIKLIVTYNKEDVKPLYNSHNDKLLSIIKNEKCDPTKIKEYVKYFYEFDEDILLELVNGGYTKHKDWDKIKFLVKQKFFIMDNLDLYLEHYDEVGGFSHLISYVNVGGYKEDYVDFVISDTGEEINVLANKWNYLGDYEPSNLVDVDRKYAPAKEQPRLKEETINAFIKMYDAASEDNINIYITSAYRSYLTQVKLYNNYLSYDSVERVDTYSSRPGHSDHQTGLAVDILSVGYNFDTFELSDAFKWLSENAYKYGFVLRYPKDKEDITGYMYESWHYRYVGEEIAKYIYDNKLTYDEYHAYFIERGITPSALEKK